MENFKKTISKETELFILSLDALLQAESLAISAYSALYGEGMDAGSGFDFWDRSELSPLFGKLKGELKRKLGDSVEENLGNLKDSKF